MTRRAEYSPNPPYDGLEDGQAGLPPLMMCRALRHLSVFILLALGSQAKAESGKPVWLLGNDFHTSLVLRMRDVPYGREISGSPDADELAIGFGASADYRGPSRPWTVAMAIVPNYAALHVVPIHGPITRRFPHSDVVLLRLSPQSYGKLLAEIDQSFARDRRGERVCIARGYYPDSRFYQSSERFYFPYVCTMWVAIKLRHAGIPFFLPRAILSNSLILQAAAKGTLLQRHGAGKFEAY